MTTKTIGIETHIATSLIVAHLDILEDEVEAFCCIEVNVLCQSLRLLYCCLLLDLPEVLLYFSPETEMLFCFVFVGNRFKKIRAKTVRVCWEVGGERERGGGRKKKEEGGGKGGRRMGEQGERETERT